MMSGKRCTYKPLQGAEKSAPTTKKRKDFYIMLYGNTSLGYSYSPDRSRDIDRFNPSTRGDYSTAYASGSKQGGYYYSPMTTHNKPKTTGHYLGNGQFVED
jgi:hypothetical protein